MEEFGQNMGSGIRFDPSFTHYNIICVKATPIMTFLGFCDNCM